ncbi:hypothetical protein [Chamaesiphon sp. VAR_48_metabat_403]|uniref:hypothetical protein n=1 Tax=Chamaesiphon sp. VAR_48_metabat_403 TaxID=2964700 RepID=UPI00286E1C56|nr:hypothetical protein [Chamaesiphon sp. VAR_48_metabat_403]
MLNNVLHLSDGGLNFRINRMGCDRSMPDLAELPLGQTFSLDAHTQTTTVQAIAATGDRYLIFDR